jgi:ABC transport system ATP-binding/permease protein
MNYLTGERLSKDLGERILFQDIDISINEGDKIALIARNGTGKSTLLKILANVMPPDNGVVRLKKGLRWSYLNQNPSFELGYTIAELIQKNSHESLSIIQKYNDLLNKSQTHFDIQMQKELEQVTAEMDLNNFWDYDRQVTEMLSKLNITNLDQSIDTLSGGQKKRLAVALELIKNPDLLIADEPTNHLDVEMIEWLENYLKRSKQSLLIVSHDRYFIDNVCDKIIELENQQLYQFNGNYAYYLEKKAEQNEIESQTLDKTKKLFKSELEWMRKSPKARTTKSKSRIGAFYETEKIANSGKIDKNVQLSVKTTRIGGKILEMKKVYKAFDDLLILQGFDYTFKKGDRIGIVGNNGTGKSTFLNIIMEIEKADSGKINRGETIVFGYYSQQGMELKADKRVVEVLRDVAESIEMADGSNLSASQLLNRFLFPPDMQHQFVSKLSGGEKRRLHLLMVLIKNPNFLILDEPTNDLDILTLNILEDFLNDFQGCLLLVSHDRYFMDKLVDHLFIFEGQGKVRDFNGTFTEYRLEAQLKLKKPSPPVEKNVEILSKQIDRDKKGLSFKEQKEFEMIESELAKLEENKLAIENSLSDSELSFEKITALSEELGKIIQSIDQKTDRWLELSEKL